MAIKRKESALLIVIAILLALILFVLAPELVVWLFKACFAVAGVVVALVVALGLLQGGVDDDTATLIAILAFTAALIAAAFGLRAWRPGFWRSLKRIGRRSMSIAFLLGSVLFGATTILMVFHEGISLVIVVSGVWAVSLFLAGVGAFRDDPPADNYAAFKSDLA